MLKALAAAGALTAASALLLPTASIASTVSPSVDGASETATVSYADLDLASSKGSDRLKGRIKVAAADVCGRARPVELADINANRACMARAIASAQPAFEAALAAARNPSVTVSGGAFLVVAAPHL